MKPHGAGSVTTRADGRFWARAPDRKRTSLGLFVTADEAHEAIETWRAVREAKGLSPRGDTFADFGAKVMDTRELDGIRGIRQERSRWTYHLAPSSLGAKSVAAIEAPDVQTFVRDLARKKLPGTKQKISRETVRRCLSLASRVFDEAVIQGVRTDNPTTRIKVKGEARTEEPWDYLRPEEQEAIWSCEDVPLWARLLKGFAWGTGLRQGEQWNLELRDLHLDGEHPHVIVRFGSKGQAPKNGRIRRVELFGIGLEAARAWVQVLPTYAPKNPLGLVFPTVTGCRRGVGAPERGMSNAEMVAAGVKKRGKVELLPEWLKSAGVARQIRWHDLRHTCASSLVAGWWGRTWTLQEVCGMLGHSSITVTQRYAHLGETSQKKAARETVGAVGRAGLEPAHFRLKGDCSTSELPARSDVAEVPSTHSSPSPVAASTHYLAFSDLLQNPRPCEGPGHPANVSEFHAPDMVEIQDNRVTLPAVETRVNQKVLVNQLTVLSPDTIRTAPSVGLMGDPVEHVPGLGAVPAPRLPTIFLAGGSVELDEGQEPFTGATDFEGPHAPGVVSSENPSLSGYDLGTALRTLASLPPEILNVIQGLISKPTQNPVEVSRGLKVRSTPEPDHNEPGWFTQTVPSKRGTGG